MIELRNSVFFFIPTPWPLPSKETNESKKLLKFSIEHNHLYKTWQKSEEGYKNLPR